MRKQTRRWVGEFVADRSWTRFSLRTFFVVITLLAVWLGVETYRARNQHSAVSALRKLGVQITYDWQHSQSDFVRVLPNTTPSGPTWLKTAVGEDYFARVVRVNFEQTQTHDSDLRWLQSLPHVCFLSLFDTPVTDEGMKYVGSLPMLQTLYFFDTQIGDEGLKHLRNATTLREIQCGDTSITNDGLVYLSELTQLEKLWLQGTQVTDAGVETLSKLKNLQYLDLRRTGVSEEGFARLKASLPNCKIAL